MSLQTFINSAQSIEFGRADLVATSVSRSGRVITQTRNTVKPWTFKVTPQPVIPWSSYRGAIETILTRDRHTEHEIQIGATPGSTWLTNYQGSLPVVDGLAQHIFITAYSGNTITIDVSSSSIPDGTVLFRAGDLIQPGGTGSDGLRYRYPYAVTADVIKSTGNTTKVITLNRGAIIQANYNALDGANGQNALRVGSAVTWRVIMTSLPGVRYVPGQFVEFTSDMSLLEMVL